jgi:hypothetical protein
MIKGDMQCLNTKIKMTNEFLGMFGGSKPLETTTITRLDKNLIWDVVHANRTCTERSLSNMKAAMESFADMGGMPGRAGEREKGFDKDNVEMSPPKFSVEKTGKKETIAGYDCEQGILTMEMEGKDTETGETFKMLLTMDMMLAQDVPGWEEQKSFNSRFATAAGLDAFTGSMSAEAIVKSMGRYGIDSEELTRETSKLEGFPMRMVATLRGEGDLLAAPTAPEETDEEAAERDEAMKKLKDLGMGGLLGGGGDEDEGESETATDPDALITVTTVVTGISTDPVPDDTFEPPSEYERIVIGETEEE